MAYVVLRILFHDQVRAREKYGEWAQVLYYAVTALLGGGHEGVYAAVERPLQLAQTAAVIEIPHGLVGLVRSPVSATLPQIGSRLFLTWGILWSFPETQSHILVTSLVISCNVTHLVSGVGCMNATSSTSNPPLYAQPMEHFDATFGAANAFLQMTDELIFFHQWWREVMLEQ
ncbi:hypothetical protein VPH35_053511 [Triticum aestivum]|uniref:Very-long-chain (3R)-3-hydroxyacyl-CoA dehydratase n=1 Tax=Triticum aestivum TaxID=4565 RepID=A0A077RW28_WHEAT|nr:unnamed protein product [Triticum aestivum]